MGEIKTPKQRISAELLQKLKAAVNLLDVVGEHVVLRKTGANAVGLCPFHSERSPSFSVSEAKQLYHCYGCKKGGDLVSFVMELHGLSFPEAIEELAERARIPLPKNWEGREAASPEEEARRQAQRERTQLAYRLNRFVATFFHQNLSRSEAQGARTYLAGRGLGEEWQRQFYVGAAIPSWDALAVHLQAKKAPLPLAADLGLIRASQPGAKTLPGSVGYFDLFRDRVVFPILDLRGRVAGFGGRLLGDADGPKYLNSPESVVFHKSKLLFGLFQAQKHIREKDEVVVVEGYFDTVALHRAGLAHAVATCGTSLTPDHLAILRRLASRVVILFDGDSAGASATLRAMELGLEHGMVFFGAELPKGLDPDEVLIDPATGQPDPEGPAKLAQILMSAQPLLDTQIAKLAQTAGQGDEAKSQALKQVGGWLAKFKEPVGRELRLESAAKALDVSVDLVRRAAGLTTSPQQQMQRSPHPQGPPPSTAPQRGRPRRPTRKVWSAGDRLLVRSLALEGPWMDHWRGLKGRLPQGLSLSTLFEDPALQGWARVIFTTPGALEAWRKDPHSGTEDTPENAELRSFLMETALQANPATALTEVESSELQGAFEKALLRVWARFSHQVREALATAEAKKDAGLHRQLMQEYLDLQRKMKELGGFYDQG